MRYGLGMISYEKPLVAATFQRRYKRFFVDATLTDGTPVVAHCANTGSMKGLLTGGCRCYLMPNPSPTAKLAYRLELMEAGESLVAVNTHRANAIAEDGITNGKIKELSGYPTLKREVKYGQNSRIDMHLSGHATLPDAYVEVKNVTLKQEDSSTALFPDAVTTRGTKHLHELMEVVKSGQRAVMFFLVNRSDCTSFSPAHTIDPTYAHTLKQAHIAGVELLCYYTDPTPQGIDIVKSLPINLM